METAKLEENQKSSALSAVQTAFWIAGLVFLGLGWLHSAWLTALMPADNFYQNLHRGWACGNPTLGFLFILLVSIFPPPILLCAAGRAKLALLMCLTLSVTALLGYFRDNDPGYELFFLGAVAFQLLPLILLDWKIKFFSAVPVNPRSVGLYIAIVLLIGALANLGFSSRKEEIFQEFAVKNVNTLKECLTRLPSKDGPQFAYHNEYSKVYKPRSPSRDRLSPELATCFVWDAEPRSNAYTWDIKESKDKVSGSLIYDDHGREFSYPFELAFPVNVK